MKRIVCIGLGLVLLLGTTVSATDTRVLTMGNNNLILEDQANIFLFPSTINRHAKLVVGEFGRYDDSEWDVNGITFTDLGIHWQLGDDNPIILGTYFANSERQLYWPFTLLDDESYLPSNQRIDLFGGTRLGDVPVGLRVKLVQSSWRDDNSSKDELSFSDFSVRAGVSAPDEKWDLAGGISLISFKDVQTSWQDETAWDRTKPEGNFQMHFGGRYFAGMQPEYTIVPHLVVFLSKYEYGNYYWNSSAERSELTSTEKINVFAFDVGSGFHWRPGSRVLVVLDVGVLRHQWDEEIVDAEPNSPEDKVETVRWARPYFKAGFEGHVFKWMDVRFGATSYWDKVTWETTYGTDVSEFLANYADNTTYLGFSFHWNSLRIDTYTDPQLFLDGLNFISGRSNDMNFMISALYEL